MAKTDLRKHEVSVSLCVSVLLAQSAALATCFRLGNARRRRAPLPAKSPCIVAVQIPRATSSTCCHNTSVAKHLSTGFCFWTGSGEPLVKPSETTVLADRCHAWRSQTSLGKGRQVVESPKSRETARKLFHGPNVCQQHVGSEL